MITHILNRYYIDGLHLPIINGANEGSITIPLFYIMTAIAGKFLIFLIILRLGCQFWTNHPLNIPNYEIVFYFLVGMSILTVFSK